MLSYVCEVQRNNGYVSTSAWICLVSALFKLGREREVKYILDAMFDWHEYFPSASSPTSPASREPNHVASRTSLTVDNFTIRFDKVGKTVAEFLLKGDVNGTSLP